MRPGFGRDTPPGYVRRGDWLVPEDKARRAEEAFSDRSRGSRARDKMTRAPIETDFETWKEHQRVVDFPGVDTPTDSPRESLLDAALMTEEGDAWLDREPEPEWMGSSLLGSLEESSRLPDGLAGRARDALRR